MGKREILMKAVVALSASAATLAPAISQGSDQKPVRIEDLVFSNEKVVEAKGVPLSGGLNRPDWLTDGNRPDWYTDGNRPDWMTDGNRPDWVTDGNRPDWYTSGFLSEIFDDLSELPQPTNGN